IVQLYAAAFWLYGQTDGALKNAAAHLRAGDALAMNARERALHRALTLWHGNDNLRAVEALEAITTEWPSDLLTAKIAEFLYYVLGQQYMGPRFRAHMRRLEGAHAGDPDFLAMAAFASERCGDSATAEAVAERALGIEPRNPWAQHGLSHVLIHQGRVRGGSCAPGSLPPAAGNLRTTDPLSRRLAPCAAASRRARRGRSDARVPDTHLGHHPGLRGRAARRHRVALAHRDGRWPHGCGMDCDRRAYCPAGGRDLHAVHERALRLCARARRPGRCGRTAARRGARTERGRRRGSETGMGAGGTRGDRGGGRLRRRRSRARRRIARSGHADDDSDRRQRRSRRPVSPDLSAQPAGRGTPRRR